MSYKALYRTYRPETFDDVIGQEHIVTTLKNIIKNNKIAHAYLFTGPRGTGKTSVANVFAREVNRTASGLLPETNHPSALFISNAPPVVRASFHEPVVLSLVKIGVFELLGIWSDLHTPTQSGCLTVEEPWANISAGAVTLWSGPA